MAKMMIVLAAVAVVGVIADVSVGREYIPPSGASGRLGEAPSALYGAPSGASDRYSDGNEFGGAADPSALYGAPSGASGRFSDGFGGPSSQYRAPGASSRLGGFGGGRGAAQDSFAQLANYGFDYKVSDTFFGTQFEHKEDRLAENAKGEYQVLLPDGRTQIVKYTANENGFNPVISYKKTTGRFINAVRARQAAALRATKAAALRESKAAALRASKAAALRASQLESGPY